MANQKEMDISFILNHLGEERHQYFNAVSPPVMQTSNFAFTSVADFREAISDELKHHIYSRGNNPTTAILRKKIAALEKTEDALVLGSGAAAVAVAIIGNVQAGDHVICIRSPYSWTYKLLVNFLSRFGVSHTFVDGRNMEEIEKAIRKETKVLYLESPNTMTYELQDLQACAKLAKANGIVTICDNSYASPCFQNPAEFGIDIVVHSATKYLNGHSDVVAGVIATSESMTKKLFNSEFMTLGTNLSPHDASLILRGLRTLPLRVERSFRSAKTVVDWLEKHPKVEEVYYPFSENFPQYELAKKQMRGGGGLLSAKFKCDSMSKMEAFCDKLERFLLAVSWGGHESLIIPACGFYGMAGKDDPDLPWNFVRFYIGLEEPEVLIKDIEQAMSAL